MKVFRRSMRFIHMTSSFLPPAMACFLRLPARRFAYPLIASTRIVVFALCAVAGPRLGAEVSPPEVRLTRMANDLSIRFLEANPEGNDATLETFLKAEQVTLAAADAVRRTVPLARSIARLGLKPGTPAFRVTLDDNTGASAGEAPARVAVGGNAPPKSALELEEQTLLAQIHEAADDNKKKEIRETLQGVEAQLIVTAKEKALVTAKQSQNPGEVERAEARLTAAKEAVKRIEEQRDPIKALTDTGPLSFLHAGVRLVSPYKFALEPDPKTKDLPANTVFKGKLETASKDDTAAFIEFVYSTRGAWNQSFLEKLVPKDASALPNGALPPEPSKAYSFLSVFDFETRLTYNFADAKANATAIAGTGDFGGEISIAAPVIPGITLHLHEPRDASLGGWSIAPEFSYGIVTGKADFDARERKFWGAGYTVSYNLGGREQANRRWLRFHAAVGRAKIDALKFVDDKSKEIEVVNGMLPRYHAINTTAFEADVIYPVSKDAHLTFGGRVYDGSRPNSWTLYLGYTRPISKILSGLFPIGEESAESGSSQSAGKKESGAASRGVGSSPASTTSAPVSSRKANKPSL